MNYPRFARHPAFVIFWAVFAAGLVWALYTQHAWEDYYITYRASKNLATGRGLTFTEGERVHSFTSPLGVLLPAAASLLTGNKSDDGALWIFRIFSLGSYAGAAVILWRLAEKHHGSRLAAGLLLILFTLDAKIIDFSTNGMETGVLMLFLAWTLYLILASPSKPAWQLGMAWAGLMWTRPDSCVYIAALAVGALFLCPPMPSAGGRGGLFKTLLAAGLFAAVLYLPWVLWAWRYYGTPVPHTITAKGLFHPPITPASAAQAIWAFPNTITAHIDMLAATFMPAYSSVTGWPVVALKTTYWIAAACLIVWILPGVRRETRLASFAFCAGQFYLTTYIGFPVPWYIPTVTVLSLLVIAGLVAQADDIIRRKGSQAARAALWAASGTLLAGSLTLTLLSAWQLRLQQAIIERGLRQPLGQWLHDHAASRHETVLLEPLGYIGFYSNLKMLDFPGLSSPEMVEARKQAVLKSYPACGPELIALLRPDWLVLRKHEAEVMRQAAPGLLDRRYALARVFDARPAVNAIPLIMGRQYLLNDACFEVYRRQP